MEKFTHVNCINCQVSDCPIAKYCDAVWRKKINGCKIVASYRKSQPIVKEDTIAAGIYIIYSGKVLIVSERKNFEKQIIRLAKPGDILEYKTTDKEIKNPFTAEAFEDSVICFIPKATFFELLTENREFTLHLERHSINKFIKAEERLKNALIMSLRAKIADALLIAVDSFNGQIPFSRKELGEMIGISSDQVSRELKKLMHEGMIEKIDQNKKIVIKDFQKLLSIVNEYDEDYSVSIPKKSAKKQKAS